MKNYLLKSKKFFNSISNKPYIFVGAIYFFLIQKIAFPLNFQQDDVSELYIVNFTDFSCVIEQGDNHPLFTNIIWILSRVFDENIEYVISSMNILISLVSLLYFYTFVKKYSSQHVAAISSLIFLSSNNFIIYSTSIKQYPLEVFGSMFFLSFLYEKIGDDATSLNDYKKLVFGLILSVTSLTLLVLFLITIFLIILNKRVKVKNIFKSLVVFSPSLFFAPKILGKLNRPSYREYWSDFFVNTESLTELFESSFFIFNLIMKGYFGLIFYEKLAVFYFLFLLIPLFYKDKISIPAYSILLIFLVFNFLKFYPLGAGRTDLILLPVVVFIISRSFFVLKLRNQYLSVLFFTLLVLTPNLNNPYYKIENITPILKDISSSVNNENAYILPMDEQRHPFEYYSSKLFGNIETTDKKGCTYLVPDVQNYSIFLPYSQERLDSIYETIKVSNPSEIYLIGIELEGTKGMIRDAEVYLTQLGFIKVSEKDYDIGMLLIQYRSQ
tara:strand:- start:48 stop:1538 length:1491 start_codon:yes stop_codon:yes gene_type:complete